MLKLPFEFFGKKLPNVFENCDPVLSMKNLLCGKEKHEQQQESENKNVNKTNFRNVVEFMNVFGQTVRAAPLWPTPEEEALRLSLIEEEVDELRDALAAKDLVEVADALTDILYVVYGAGATFGLNLDECFREVHCSNMSKLGENGEVIYRTTDGKVMKGPNYFSPDLEKVLENSRI